MMKEDTKEYIDGIIEFLEGIVYDANVHNNMEKKDMKENTFWDGQISVADELLVLLREIG